jgi:hypothetical protein
VRDLLAAKPGGSPAPAGGEPHVLGLKVRAALAQEIGQLGAAALIVGTDNPDGARGESVRDDGGNFYYQDNSFSCTWISMIADYTT